MRVLNRSAHLKDDVRSVFTLDAQKYKETFKWISTLINILIVWWRKKGILRHYKYIDGWWEWLMKQLDEKLTPNIMSTQLLLPPPPSLCDLPSHSNFGSYRNVFRKTQQEKIAELIHRPKNRLSFIIFNVLENACAINKTQFNIFGKLYPNDGVEKSEKERMSDENGPIDALDGMV